MQMQMEQTPQTIAQQREQEVLGLTKNELAQQTAGIMQQRQQQQQKGLQRMAKAAGGAPAGGIAGLAPQGGPPAPRRMAGGGVVAFEEGGPVAALEAEINRLRSELEALGPYSRVGVTPPGAEDKYARIKELEQKIRDAERRLPLAKGMIAGESLPPVGGGVGALRGARRAREEDIAAIRGMITGASEAAPAATGLPAMAQPTAAAPAGASGGAPSGGFFSPSGPGAALAGGTAASSSAGSTAGSSGSASSAIAPGSVTGVSVRPDPATTVPNVEPPAAATPDRLGRLGDRLETIAGENIEAAGTAATPAAREGYTDPDYGRKNILTQIAGTSYESLVGIREKSLILKTSVLTGLSPLLQVQLISPGHLRHWLLEQKALWVCAKSSGRRVSSVTSRSWTWLTRFDLTRIGIEKDVQARASEALSRASARVNAAIQAASNIASAEMRSADANADRVLQAAGINAKTAADNAANALREARNVIADRQATAAERQAAARALTAELETLNQLDQRILRQSATMALSNEQKGELDTLTDEKENRALRR